MDNNRTWLKEALQSKGFKQQDVAKQWGVSEGAVSRWISGQDRQDLPASRLKVVADMLGTTMDALFASIGPKGTGTPPPPPALNDPRFAGIDEAAIEVIPQPDNKVRLLFNRVVSTEQMVALMEALLAKPPVIRSDENPLRLVPKK